MIQIIANRLIEAFIGKKKLIGWVSAIGIAVGAVAAGMSSQEFKDAVCSAPVINAGSEQK